MIDAHHHFWQYREADYPWMNESLATLRRDYLPDHLKTELDAAGISGVVSVQARQILEETNFLLNLAAQNPFVRGVVGWVPLIDRDVGGILEQYAANARLKGVRHVLHDEADDGYMLRADFNAGLSCLATLGLRYDLLIFARHLPVGIQLVDRHPRQIFILDHIAKPNIKQARLEPWRTDLRNLARRPNVYCKLSGMVTEADWAGWSEKSLQPYVDTVLEAFGPQRIMFGSDWPVCAVAGGYQRWFNALRSLTARLTADEQEWIYERTATQAYRL